MPSWIALMASFSVCQWATMPSRSSRSDVSSPSSASRRALLASSVSLASAAFSISSWRMRRSTTSISNGIESISIRRRDAASSTRSIALSGSCRPVM
jgi:hypothetical protein